MTAPTQNQKAAPDNEGLPEIANSNPAKVRAYALFGCALILLLIGWLFFGKSEKKEKKKPQDEIFAVENLAPDMGAKKDAKSNSRHEIKDTKPSAIQPKTKLLSDQHAQLIEKQKELKMRLEAPVMVVANSSSEIPESSNATKKVASNPNTQFLNELSNQESATVQAKILHNPSNLVSEGHLIYATMESAVNTDLPGHLRATVSFPVYSEDGSQILIPTGSRLIGQYKSGMLQGQSRIFIVWTRLITPHISLPLGSPGIDALGAAGIQADHIDRHFWQMFGSASLLSLIGAGSSHMGIHSNDQPNSASAYRQAIAQSFSQSANSTLKESILPPTLTIDQGQVIHVFVAKDLRFDRVGSALPQAFRIFD